MTSRILGTGTITHQQLTFFTNTSASQVLNILNNTLNSTKPLTTFSFTRLTSSIPITHSHKLISTTTSKKQTPLTSFTPKSTVKVFGEATTLLQHQQAHSQTLGASTPSTTTTKSLFITAKFARSTRLAITSTYLTSIIPKSILNNTAHPLTPRKQTATFSTIIKTRHTFSQLSQKRPSNSSFSTTRKPPSLSTVSFSPVPWHYP